MDYFLFNFSGVQFHYTMSHKFILPQNMQKYLQNMLKSIIKYQTPSVI